MYASKLRVLLKLLQHLFKCIISWIIYIDLIEHIKEKILGELSIPTAWLKSALKCKVLLLFNKCLH